MTQALIGHYPTDPTGAIGDITTYFKNHDVKFLIHGVYDLAGFAINIFVGEPANIQIDPTIVADSVKQMHEAMATSQAVIPIWVKPILQAGLSALLAWLQGRLTQMHFARTGTVAPQQQQNP
jgi:ribosomal protein S3